MTEQKPKTEIVLKASDEGAPVLMSKKDLVGKLNVSVTSTTALAGAGIATLMMIPAYSAGPGMFLLAPVIGTAVYAALSGGLSKTWELLRKARDKKNGIFYADDVLYQRALAEHNEYKREQADNLKVIQEHMEGLVESGEISAKVRIEDSQ